MLLLEEKCASSLLCCHLCCTFTFPALVWLCSFVCLAATGPQCRFSLSSFAACPPALAKALVWLCSSGNVPFQVSLGSGVLMAAGWRGLWGAAQHRDLVAQCGDPTAWCWPPDIGDQYRNSSGRTAGKKCRETCLQWCKGNQQVAKIQINWRSTCVLSTGSSVSAAEKGQSTRWEKWNFPWMSYIVQKFFSQFYAIYSGLGMALRCFLCNNPHSTV